MKYKKSQTGWIIIGILVPVILFFFLIYVSQWGDNPLPFIPFIVLVVIFVIIIALFYKLTIEFDGSVLKLSYGIGLIRIRFKIDKLIETQIIKTPWYYGLGIRITPKGMLYNIQGSKALDIKYISNGKNKKIMVGSSEPERLKQALDDNFKK